MPGSRNAKRGKVRQLAAQAFQTLLDMDSVSAGSLTRLELVMAPAACACFPLAGSVMWLVHPASSRHRTLQEAYPEVAEDSRAASNDRSIAQVSAIGSPIVSVKLLARWDQATGMTMPADNHTAALTSAGGDSDAGRSQLR